MGTRALVTGTEKLLLVDLDEHRVEVVEDHRTEYYGISWPRDGGRLCLSHSGVDNAKMLNLEDYAHSEKGWLSIGNRESERFLSAPHQIVCVDDFVVATNTGRNSLALVRTEDQYYRQFRLTDALWDRLSVDRVEGAHLNSVFRADDRLFVIAHNHHNPSHVLVLSWPGMALIDRIELEGPGAHNVWLDDGGRICVCDTMRGQIVDARSGQVLWSAGDADALVRGAARRGDRMWVGDSARATREGRKHADGIIYALDCTRWQVRDQIVVPNCGGIHEIRLIDDPDSCHHGFPLRVPVRADAAATERHQQRIAELEAQRQQTHGWTFQLGGPDILTGTGEITFAAPGLAIATQPGPHAENVRVDAKITVPSDVTSVFNGLVARYVGPSDQNMVTGMIYRVDARLRADIWRHCDGAWTMLACTLLGTTADTLEVALIADGPMLTMLVDNQVVLQTPDPMGSVKGIAGVRGMIGTVAAWSAQALLK